MTYVRISSKWYSALADDSNNSRVHKLRPQSTKHATCGQLMNTVSSNSFVSSGSVLKAIGPDMATPSNPVK